MIAKLLPGDNCVICNEIITDEWKEILNQTKFAQTWCISCVAKSVNLNTDSPINRDIITELRELKIEVSQIK